MTDDELLSFVPSWHEDGNSHFLQSRAKNRRVTIASVDERGTSWRYGTPHPTTVSNKARPRRDVEKSKLAVYHDCLESGVAFAAFLVAYSKGKFIGLVSTMDRATLPTVQFNDAVAEFVLGEITLAYIDGDNFPHNQPYRTHFTG